MAELIQVGEHTYYMDGLTKVGFYVNDNNEVYLIDSGNDKDAGRKIRQTLEQNGWTLKMILNTHSNADHIGGNNYLQRQSGCKILGYDAECEFTKKPILEASFLYGGYPCADLRHKFLLAKESNSEEMTAENLPEEIEMIELPGHYFDMVGFKTDDDVIFLADCLSSEDTLNKYQISFIYDVEAYLNTLEYVKTLTPKAFVPSHAPACEDIAPLAQKNIDKVHEIAEFLLSLCNEPKCFEEILKIVFDRYSLKMNFEQYVLVGSTVRSYLSWLKDKGELSVTFDDNIMRWVKNN